jgi:hypothetical protein
MGQGLMDFGTLAAEALYTFSHLIEEASLSYRL